MIRRLGNQLKFRPRSLEVLRNYDRGTLGADVAAGLTVGVVALPLAMAFAIASGAPPQAGLVTAVIAGFIISAFGGTRVCVGGPTGAFVVILNGIAMQYGWNSLAVCTLMAGAILVLLGVSGLGKIIKYMPYPVTMGFTSGIAVLIISTQVNDFLGLGIPKVPAEFFAKAVTLYKGLPDISISATAVAVGTFALIRIWPRKLARRVPGTVVAITTSTVICAVAGLPIETISSRFGAIPQGFPPLQLPQIDWAHIHVLIAPATTIALLAAIESLLCAVVADGMTDDNHDSNQELVAQGLANMVTPLFGGLAATSAMARTATNIRSGARTPVAGIVHAVTLMVILLAAAPLAGYIPLAALSAVLLNVALHMGEWHNFRNLRRWPPSDALVFLTAFLLTVIFDLTIAVQTGVVMAALLFIKRIAETSEVTPVTGRTDTEGSQHTITGKDVPEGVMVYRVVGALFFGAANKLEAILPRVKHEPEVLILRMRKVVAIDATGLNSLNNLREKLHKHGKALVLSGPQRQPLESMQRSGFIDELGSENLCPDIDAALLRAKEILKARKQG